MLGDFRSLQGAYVCNMFLKCTGFATKLALVFLEPLVHSFFAVGAAGDLLPVVGNVGPVELGPWAALGFFSGVKAIPASCSFLLAFASSALSGL